MYQRRLSIRLAAVIAPILAVALVPVAQQVAAEQAAQIASCQTFAETGKSVCGRFLGYWQGHGGVAQQGYPISHDIQEVSAVDGKTYVVQYFERAVFEYHPENQAPFGVLLSLLGSELYKLKYPNGAPGQQANSSPGSVFFAETGRRLGGRFLGYWQSYGAVMQQGYPVSDEFQERSEVDGKQYTVQYFERAAFEFHPENAPPYDVLLSQLGTLQFKRKYQRPVSSPTPDAYASLGQRPLQLPALPPDGVCPTSQGRVQALPAPAYPSSINVLGRGPVFLEAADTTDVATPSGMAHVLPQQNGMYRIKGPWISRPEYPGPILVRGRKLDGSDKVRCEYSPHGYQSQEAMRLDVSNNNGTNYGWSFWPSGIVFSSLGCYGLQIDGLNFTDVIILKVIAEP
jgi:hypothetical protein